MNHVLDLPARILRTMPAPIMRQIPLQGPDGKIEVFQRRSDGLIVSKRMHRKATDYAKNLHKLPGVSPADEYKMESALWH